jgi:hypothetical protein
MPIDPSIVSNAFANVSMPDVNALMNQRVRGAENIYQIETARQAQAAEDEKAAAKAQEDAAVKALLPAYAHAFKTGDMRTALSLAPAEYQDGLLQYVEALDGKPIEEIQAALIGSLSSSPAGQEALSAIQRGQTFGVQSRQQTLAEQRFAAEQKAAADEAARGPQPEFEKVELQDGTLGLLDKKSGRIVQPTMEGATGTELPTGETVGGPIKIQTAETKQQAKEQVKLDAAFPKASKAVKATVTSLDQDIADVKKLLKDRKGLTAITGTYNAMTPDIMADATRAAALYDKITAGAGFTALGDLKAASPTGGALGAVSDDEGRRLRASVATFSRKQTTPDFVDGLERYLVDLEMSRENVLSAFDETYSYREDADAASIAQDLQTQRSRLEQEILTPKLPPAPSGVKVIRKN